MDYFWNPKTQTWATQDQVNLNDYQWQEIDPAGDSGFLNQDSVNSLNDWASTILGSINAAYPALTHEMGAVTRGVGDAISGLNPWLGADYGQSISNLGQGIMGGSDVIMNDVRNSWGLNNLEPDSWQNTASNVITGTTSLAAKAPLLAAGRLGAAATFAIPAAAETYNRLMTAGDTQAEAAQGAALTGGANALVGALPVQFGGPLLEKGMGALAKDYLAKAVELGLFNLTGTSAEILADELSGKRAVPMDEKLSRMENSVLEAPLMAAPLALYSKGAQKFTRPTPTIRDIGEVVDLNPPKLTEPEIIKQQDTTFPQTREIPRDEYPLISDVQKAVSEIPSTKTSRQLLDEFLANPTLPKPDFSKAERIQNLDEKGLTLQEQNYKELEDNWDEYVSRAVKEKFTKDGDFVSDADGAKEIFTGWADPELRALYTAAFHEPSSVVTNAALNHVIGLQRNGDGTLSVRLLGGTAGAGKSSVVEARRKAPNAPKFDVTVDGVLGNPAKAWKKFQELNTPQNITEIVYVYKNPELAGEHGFYRAAGKKAGSEDLPPYLRMVPIDAHADQYMEQGRAFLHLKDQIEKDPNSLGKVALSYIDGMSGRELPIEEVNSLLYDKSRRGEVVELLRKGQEKGYGKLRSEIEKYPDSEQRVIWELLSRSLGPERAESLRGNLGGAEASDSRGLQAGGGAGAKKGNLSPPSLLREILGRAKTEEVPTSSLKLSEEVPNFKEEFKPLKADSYDELGTAPIITWRRNDGALEVISGRHKFDLAQRLGKTVVKTQELREADGVTADMARKVDFVINVRKGQGSIADASRGFKKLGFGEAEVAELGLTQREVGKAGWEIATNASEPLYSMHQAGKISDKLAVMLAKEVPKNEGLQRLGMAMKEKNIPFDEIQDAVIDARNEQARETTEQGALFNMSDNSSIKMSVDQQVVAGNYRKRLENLDKLVASIKNVDDLKKMGLLDPSSSVSVTPAQLKFIRKEIKTDIAKARKWRAFPELKEQISKLIEPEVNFQKYLEKARAPRKNGIIDDEGGFIRIPSYEEMKAAFLGKIDHPAQYESLRRVIRSQGGDPALVKDATPLDPVEAVFSGRILGADIPVLSPMRKVIEKGLTRPIWLAENSPEFEPIWREVRQEWKERELIGAQLGEIGKDYFDIIDKTKVDEALQAARIKADELAKQGKKLSVTPAALQAFGLSPKDIAGYQAYRNMMEASWKLLGSEIKAAKKFPDPAQQAAWDKRVDDYFANNYNEHYAPIHRFGKYTVWAEKPGAEPEYYHFETTGQRAEAIKNLVARKYLVTPGEVKPTSDAMKDSMPMDLRMALGELLPDQGLMEGLPRPIQGFKPHMMKAELVKGYGKDLDRQTAEYLTGLSNFVARIRHADVIKRGMEAIEPKAVVDPVTGKSRTVGKPKLYDEAADWLKYIRSPNSEWGALRGAMAHYYLGFGNLRSAVLNRTQPYTTVYPELRRYSKTPFKDLHKAKSFFKLWDKNESAATARDPELSMALREALREGVVGEEFSRELANLRNTGKSKFGRKPSLFDVNSWSDLSMKFFSLAEYKNRGETFVAGWNAKPNLPFEARKKFAEDFVDKTQYMYSKLNRPRWGRGGIGASLMTFRMFPINYLAQIRDVVTDRNLDNATKRAIAKRFLLTMGALGGVRALPFAKTLIGAGFSAGQDWQKDLRDTLGNRTLSDLILYGLPFQLGFDISGAMSPDPIQNVDKGIGPAVASTVGGVPLDIFYTRPKKALRNYSDTKSLAAAVEPLLPNALYNLNAGRKAFRDDAFKDYKGALLVQSPSFLEKAAKTAGFTPPSLSRAYEEQASRMNAQIVTEAETAGYNRQIGIALANGKNELAQALMQELVAKGGNPNAQAIKETILSIKNPAVGQLYGAPKRVRPAILDSMETYKTK